MTRPALSEAAVGTASGTTPLAVIRVANRHRAWTPATLLAGSGLLVLAGIVPIWGTHLQAPQYPDGLSLWFYGGRVEGPVREVNGLNHYIGMRPIELEIVPELAVWPLAILALGFALAVAITWRGWIGRLALIGLWAAPVLILADIQRWLITFGTTLDRTSALRLEPFVPLVIGPNSVWNFTVWTYPGPALGLVLLVALLATLARRRPSADRTLTDGAAVAGLALLLAGTLVIVAPAVRGAPPAAGPNGAAVPAADLDLQARIDATPAGTLRVPAGRYQGNFVVDRSLTLVADGEVLLDGGGRGSVVTITAPDVVLRGFRIASTGGQVEEGSAVKVVGAERVTIEGNRIERFFTGITALDSAALRVIDNELIGSGQVKAEGEHLATDGAPSADASSGSGPVATGAHAGHGAGAGPRGQGDAITLWNVDGALLRGNTIREVRDAIYLNYADEVLVDTNDVSAARYGLHAMFGSGLTVFDTTLRGNLSGAVLMYTRDVLIGRSRITDHVSIATGVGVVVKEVTGLRLAENVIARNRIGLRVEGTRQSDDAEALVLANRLAANGVGVALMASADLSFGTNAFDANLTDVLALEPGVERRNVWSYHGAGNTWSAYAGYDLAADGVGDVPHTAGGLSQALLAAAPALEQYRATPAFAVLAGAQTWWDAAREPVVIDPHPLTVAMAPEASAARPPALPWAWHATGALLLGSMAWVALRLHRAGAA